MKSNSQNKKKNMVFPVIIMIIIAVFTSFTIVSCGGDTKTADSGTSNTATAAANQTKENKNEKKEEASDKKDETSKESSEKASSSKKNEATVRASTSGTASTKAAAKSTAKSTTKSTTKSSQAAKVCYISIEGYCSNKKVNMQSGDSVYDILNRSGAKVSARNSGYGIYVEGINGRFEFDEGPTSGWMYYVNGSKPNKSFGEYKVSSGDNIVWDYVSEL